MGRRKPSYLSLTDLFCGAGGASIGAEAAGLKLVLGINHWQRAIETHQANFPGAAHDCRDVSETHPSRYGSTHLLWASPECPTWSQARGKRRNFAGQTDMWEPLPTEAEEKSRVTMWDVVRYAEYHDYEAVVVENVVDLMPWYLLPAWLEAMHTLGYAHRALFLNSMVFGVPQSRDRVYFVFWRRGNRAPDLDYRPTCWCSSCHAVVGGVQTWKRPAVAQGRYRAQYTYRCPACGSEAAPYVRPAAAAIDWSVPGERIGDRKKPLAEKTRARIQAGMDRYWGRAVVLDTMRDPKLRDAATQPGPTQTARQSLALVTHQRGTHRSAIHSSTKGAGEPIGTITGGGIHRGLLEPPEPLLVKHYTARGDAGQMSHPASEPLGTITGADHHSLLLPPLLYVGRSVNRSRPSDEPMPTLTTGGNMGLVVPSRGPGAHRETSARPTDDPLATVLGEVDRGLLVPAGGTRRREAASAEAPMPARTTTENDALVTPPLVVKAAGSTYDPGTYKRIRPAGSNPLWTQTATAEAAVEEAPEAFLSSYYGSGFNTDVLLPMPTLTSRHRHALVEGLAEIDIEDCFFRMLLPPEIGRGQAFEDSYIVTGNNREKVRQYGQAVTPPVPAWLWRQIVATLA